MTDYGTLLSAAQVVSRWTRMKARESFRRRRAPGVRCSRRRSSGASATGRILAENSVSSICYPSRWAGDAREVLIGDVAKPTRLGHSLPPVPTHRARLRRLRHKRGRRYLDFAACDVGRGTTNADRGHDVPALASLGFNFASAAHQDALLDR